MEKTKLILLLPLSRFLFTLSRQSDASLFLFFLFVVISFSSCMHTFNNRVVVFETLSFRESAFVVERGGERRFSFW